MGRVWVFIVVVLVVAFLAGMTIESATSMLGNAFLGIVRGVVSFFQAVTGSNNGEAVG